MIPKMLPLESTTGTDESLCDSNSFSTFSIVSSIPTDRTTFCHHVRDRLWHRDLPLWQLTSAFSGARLHARPLRRTVIRHPFWCPSNPACDLTVRTRGHRSPCPCSNTRSKKGISSGILVEYGAGRASQFPETKRLGRLPLQPPRRDAAPERD